MSIVSLDGRAHARPGACAVRVSTLDGGVATAIERCSCVGQVRTEGRAGAVNSTNASYGCCESNSCDGNAREVE